MEVIKPSSEKQSRFWSSTADVLLFGGAAGGGKSFALIVDALGLSERVPSILVMDYNALIIRKTHKELAGILAETSKIYPIVCPGCELIKSRSRWEFPSGAKITFGVSETEDDITKYQGLEYSYIAIDEAGLYSTDYVFRFLMGRLRNSVGLPNRFRMTSNPTRHKWLRELFGIGPEGHDTFQIKNITLPNGSVIKKKYQYIQSKLEDNKMMNYNDYAANIMQMDEATQKAWLMGRWDSFDTKDGLIYLSYVEELEKSQRFCKLSYLKGIDLDIYSDMGRDGFPLLFVQRFGKEIRILKEYFNQNVDISHYVETIVNICKTNGWKVSRWILPWDGKNKHVNSEFSTLEMAQKLMPDVEIVSTENSKNLPREQGISNVISKFPNLYIDSSCVFLKESLEKYKRKYNKQTDTFGEPEHKIWSHMSDCLRYVCQDDSYDLKKRIADIDINQFMRPSESIW